MRAARREEMGNEQEERQRNEISKINKGDIGSDGEQNNKEKERKKERKVAQRRGMEGDISIKKDKDTEETYE